MEKLQKGFDFYIELCDNCNIKLIKTLNDWKKAMTTKPLPPMPKMPAHRLDVSILEIKKQYFIACENQDDDGAERLHTMFTDLENMRDGEIRDFLDACAAS